MSHMLKTLITGDGRRITVKQLVSKFNNLVCKSLPIGGRIEVMPTGGYSIKTDYKADDNQNFQEIKTSELMVLETEEHLKTGQPLIKSIRRTCHSFGGSENIEILTAKLDDNSYVARLKKAFSGNLERQLLEIWNFNELLKVIDISEVDQHGPIATEYPFSSMQWYPFDNKNPKLLYVSHKKTPKHQSFFPNSQKLETGVNTESKYLKKDNWGESLENVEHTILSIIDINNDFKVTTIDVPNFSLMQSKWLKDLKVVSAGLLETSRKLGAIYYNCRPSSIFVHDINTGQVVIEIGDSSFSYYSPRVSNKGDMFVYLKSKSYGAHFQDCRINWYNLQNNNQVECPKDLYIYELSHNCFTRNDSAILFLRTGPVLKYISCVFLEGATMIDLNSRKRSNGSFTEVPPLSIFDFKDNIIYLAISSFDTPPQTVVGTFDEEAKYISWYNESEPINHFDDISYFDYKVPIPDKPNDEPITAYLISPILSNIQKDYDNKANEELVIQTNNLPTIVCLHGGPHMNYTDFYIQFFHYMIELGFNCLLINYRGSTGVSPKYLRTLAGNVGIMDVEDCLSAIKYFIKPRQESDQGLINPNKLVLNGGSHGGHLACHLSTVKEFNFKGAAIRNPVVDISSMYQTSDIPDWCWNVALGQTSYDFTMSPTPNQLLEMYKTSAILKADSAYVPTLMLLGCEDKRVNMYQGERWVDILKAKGIETVCKIYKDKHDLAKPESRADASISVAIWFLEHLNYKIE